jgi:hypothetical protein
MAERLSIFPNPARAAVSLAHVRIVRIELAHF